MQNRTSRRTTLLYKSLALRHLSYCCLIWAINYPASLIRLVGPQKRAVGVIIELPLLRTNFIPLHSIWNTWPFFATWNACCCSIGLDMAIHRPVLEKKIIYWRRHNENLPFLRHHDPLAIKCTRTANRQHAFRIYATKLFNILNNLNQFDFNVPISQFKTAISRQLMLLHWN